MISLIIAAIILLGTPLGLLFFFKANAGILFFAACAGLILLGSLDPTLVSTAAAVVPSEGEGYVRLLVVLLSMLFAALTFKGTVQGGIIAVHVFLALFISGLLAVSLPRATGLSWFGPLAGESLWLELENYKTLVIAVGFSLSLVALLGSSKEH